MKKILIGIKDEDKIVEIRRGEYMETQNHRWNQTEEANLLVPPLEQKEDRNKLNLNSHVCKR